MGHNARQHSDMFEEEVRMWVFEEQVDGKNLTDIINEKHENVKYDIVVQSPYINHASDNSPKRALDTFPELNYPKMS